MVYEIIILFLIFLIFYFFNKLNKTEQAIDKLVNHLTNPIYMGSLGEINLRNLIIKSGLLPYCDFNTNIKINGELRPDLVINLPNENVIYIDSKVPLRAYIMLSKEKDKEKKKIFKKQNLDNIKKHISLLGNKSYHTRSSIPFTIMVIPIENIYLVALEEDNLIDYANNYNVLICTPISLVPVLKIINLMSNKEILEKKYNEYSNNIENFKRFIEDLEALQNSLENNKNKLQKLTNEYKKMINNIN